MSYFAQIVFFEISTKFIDNNFIYIKLLHGAATENCLI